MRLSAPQVRLTQVDPIPLAVVRRRAKPSDLPFNEDGEVVRSATPRGLAATAVHLGPYRGLGAAHDDIRMWCKTNGHRLTGLNWEIYGHWQPEWNTDPSRIRTDVFYQLVPAESPAGRTWPPRPPPGGESRSPA